MSLLLNEWEPNHSFEAESLRQEIINRMGIPPEIILPRNSETIQSERSPSRKRFRKITGVIL